MHRPYDLETLDQGARSAARPRTALGAILAVLAMLGVVLPTAPMLPPRAYPAPREDLPSDLLLTARPGVRVAAFVHTMPRGANDPVNPAHIVTPPDQGNAEGDMVSWLLSTPDRGTVPLTFSATGLPPGLKINPNTGEISGRVSCASAQAGVRPYLVNVKAEVGGNVDQQSFKWYVQDTNRIRLLDDVVSRAGQAAPPVPLCVEGTGRFSATGLPPGLRIDPRTGRISGRVPFPRASGIATYPVTLEFTAEGETDRRHVRWLVLSGDKPIVLLGINDTFREEDDVLIVEPKQKVPVLVELYAPAARGPLTVTLSVPSGRTALSTNRLVLTDGQRARVWATAVRASEKEGDAAIIATLEEPKTRP